MTISYYIVLGALYAWVLWTGCCIGSFLNVVIYRVPLGISVAKGRSFCTSCHSKICWYDNIPVLSWIFLHGMCRNCSSRISARYPFIEALTGVIALITVLRYGFTLQALILFALTAVLISIAVIDYDTMTIPNGLILAIFLLAILSVWIMPYTSFPDRAAGFAIVSIPMFAITLLIPGAFGGGDIKLMAAVGLLLGWKLTVLSAFIGIVLGGAYASYLLLSKKIQSGKETHMAFGPYLSAGIWFSAMWGSYIISWYTGFFR